MGPIYKKKDAAPDSRVDRRISDGPLRPPDRSTDRVDRTDLLLDGPKAELPGADLPSDLPAADLGRADLPKVDLRTVDLPEGPDLAKPDQPKPDQPKPDLPKPDQAKPDLPKPDQCVPPAAWWNPSYHHRARLTINKSGASLPAGYSVAAVLDTQSLIAGGKLLASGDDLRVVRASAGTVELDRRLVGLGTAQTQVWLKTQDVVSTSDATYFLYFGNTSATSPPAAWADSMGSTSKVYLAADDFESGTVGAIPPGWVGSANYKVELDGTTKVVSINGTSPDANYLFAGDFAWTDVVVEAQLRVVLTGGTYYGLFTHAVSASNFDTLWFGLSDNNSLQCFTCRIASPTAKALTSSTLHGNWGLSPAAGTTWHTVTVRYLGQNASFLFDGKSIGSYTLSAGQMTQGRIGLCSGYTTAHAHWDDIVVRRYASPEPTVAVAPTESTCP
jgi:hypothetical protein